MSIPELEKLLDHSIDDGQFSRRYALVRGGARWEDVFGSPLLEQSPFDHGDHDPFADGPFFDLPPC
jgi:hypothetical protein